jgi:hypothetical protein
VAEPTRVCVVGPETRFLSGITCYTYSLIGALSGAGYRCSAVLIRDLVPARLYPGRSRAGSTATSTAPPDVTRVDWVNWYWGWSLARTVALLRRERPHVVVLQWRIGAVRHTYLVLAIVARLHGAKVVVEFHEAQDAGEARLPFLTRYVDLLGKNVLRFSAAQVVHSRFDRYLVKRRFGVSGSVALVPPAEPAPHTGPAEHEEHQEHQEHTEHTSTWDDTVQGYAELLEGILR